MPFTIDDILSDPLVTVIERDDEMGNFALKIGSLQTVIFISLGRARTSQTTKFNLSHAIHTTVQIGAYRTSIPFADYWEYALQKAVSGLTSYYKQAVTAGHTPNEDWLVKY